MPKASFSREPARLLSIILLGAAAAVWPSRGPNAAAWTGRIVPVNAAGYAIDLDRLPSPLPRPVASPAGAPMPLFVRVGLPWDLIEKSGGMYDWSVTDQIVRSHAEAGFAVILNPRGGNTLHAPGPTAASSEEAWVGFLRALAGRYAAEVDHYLLGRGDASIQDMSAREAAYWLKVSSVAIQSADPGASIALGPLDASRPDAAAFLGELYGQDVAPYVEAVALTGASGPPAAEALSAVRAVMQLGDASAGIWRDALEVPAGPGAAGALLRSYLGGLDREVALSIFQLDYGPDGAPELLPVLDRIRVVFLPTHAPLVESGRGIQVLTPMGQAVPVSVVRLFDPESKKVIIAYDAGESAPRGSQAVMLVDSADLADPVLKDIAAGESAPAGAFQVDGSAGVTRVAVPLADYPLLLEYRRFTSPLFGEEEKLQVTGRRLPSVEEILARHQAFQAAQDALLANARADARVDYHFRIGSGSTIDVTLVSSFFYEPKVGAEFEHKEFYVNGVRWRSDRVPEFPLPQPEKVMTLPLDITLDRRYRYELEGEEKVDGFDCWVVSFAPAEEAGNLYKGRVWIDKATGAKVQISSLQTGLQPPIISNDEKDSYRPVSGPGGVSYWLLSRIDGQQIFTATGRNLILVREVAFGNHVVNDAGFADLRRQAYASDHQIVRETPSGLRYLERTPEGGRTVKEIDRDSLFLLGGVFYNRRLDYPLPLAGINYFNRDLGGHGIQTNVLFGGLLLIATAGKPDIFGSGLEVNADLFAQGFSSTDRPVRLGEEIEEEGVDQIGQHLAVGLGWPFADHWKVKATGALDFQGFSHDEETQSGFIIPTDTAVATFGLEGEFNRDAWSVVAYVQSSRRSDWEPWGDPNGPSGAEFTPESKEYVRYEATVAKDFFLPLNQKIHASVSGYGGEDLDRFSKYRFDYFGNRLRGLGGTGYRFTNGLRGQAQYAFNLGEVVRFEATLDHAVVRDRQAVEPDDDFFSFTGFGLSGQTILGPNLIVSLDWGIAIGSEVEEFRGDQEIFVTILKLFR